MKEVNKRKLPGVFDFLPICRLRPKQRKPFDKDQTKHAFPIMDKIECKVHLKSVMEFVFDGAWSAATWRLLWLWQGAQAGIVSHWKAIKAVRKA